MTGAENRPDDAPVGEPAGKVPCSMGDLIRYFLRLGALGFGGPIALAGYMQRDLVEERRWFTETDYKEGLTLSQLSPGPLAGQLATALSRPTPFTSISALLPLIPRWLARRPRRGRARYACTLEIQRGASSSPS
jgi:hypothetical protein